MGDTTTTDDQIGRELAGGTDGGNPEGSEVQAGLTSPTGTPDYLSFLNSPGPGAGSALGENVEMDAPPPTHVAGAVSHKGATLSPLEPRGYQAPDVRDPMAMAGAAMGNADRDERARAAAVQGKADVEEKYHADQAEILRAQHEEQLSWAGVDERVAAAAATEAHKYIAAYQTQIAAVRQMTVDPTGPLGSLHGWKAAGLSMAMFAQGFLAARGIKIDVSGQIDRWVDRSIHEQERRIGQAEAGAKDQLTLWETARQTSRDDAEARQRYRGWVIAATQTALQVSSAGYQSELAQADAQEKIAALQGEADKTKYSIWANTYQLVHADRTLQETHRHNVVTESIDSVKAQAELTRAARQPKVKQEKIPGYIPDYSHPVTDQKGNVLGYAVAGKVSPETPAAPERYKELTDAAAAGQQAIEDLKELKQFHAEALREFKGVDFGVGAILQDTKVSGRLSDAKRRYESLKTTLAGHMAKASFGRATQTEFQKMMDAMPFDKFVQSGSSIDILDDKIDESRREFANKVSTAEQLDKSDLEQVGTSLRTNERGEIYVPKSGYGQEDIAAAGAVRDAQAEGAPDVKTAVGREFHDADQELGSGGTTRGWLHLMNKGAAITVAPPPGLHSAEMLALWAVRPDMAKHAAANDPAIGAVADDDATTSNDAMRALIGLTKNEDARMAHYARALIGAIHSDPEEITDLMVNWQVTPNKESRGSR